MRTDLYGDPLPEGAVARIGTVRLRHVGGALWVAFAADGQILISIGNDAVCVWDARTGRERHRLSLPSSCCHALSPDGKTLVTGHKDRMRLWDLSAGREVPGPAPPFEPNMDPAVSLAFGPGGAWLAIGRKGGTIEFWDLKEGKKKREFASGEVDRGLAVSPDGKTLAGAGPEPGTVHLWDVASGKKIHRFQGDEVRVRLPVFSPDGKRLATTGWDKLVHLWDPITGKEVGRLRGHESVVRTATFSPGGETLASGDDRTIRLWDVATGKEVRRWKMGTYQAVSLVYSPDGKRLTAAAANWVIRIWDPETGKECPPPGGTGGVVSWAAFSPDGKTVVTVGGDQIGLWDPATGRRLRAFDGPGENGLALSPNGTTLATVNECDGALRLWDVASGKETRRWEKEGTRHAAFSPDGRSLAASRWEDTGLWDLADGKEGRRLHEPKRPGAVAFAPDGQSLAIANLDRAVRDCTFGLWDAATGKERWHTDEPLLDVQALAFSPDGRELAVGGWEYNPLRDRFEGTVSLRDAATGKVLRRCERQPYHLQAVAFSPDGRTLATSSFDTAVRLWEAATAGERRRLAGHRARTCSLSFSPGGDRLASASFDGTALVWDLTGGTPLEPTPESLKSAWETLASDDAAVAYRAIGSLASAPRQAVPFLRSRLSAVPAAEPKRLRERIGDLDSDKFEVRERAGRELEALGDAAVPVLRQALENPSSPEVGRRLKQLLERAEGWPPEVLRPWRALEVLERIGSPEAREVVELLAWGAPVARLTQEAKASLQRLARRAGP